MLQWAAEEADRLRHSYIGTEHLLLALLAESGDSVAGQVLEAHGVRLPDARAVILASTRADDAAAAGAVSPTVFVGDVRARIAGLKRLFGELMRTPRDSPEARRLAETIDAELDALDALFG